ncbi:hypothetical protein H4R20_003438 [Coemansia guatemalensis]|uniref:Transmembrane protein n=1 Tax=Coemansia guatemalensis TaxID=2761395 RepID=A0A9W8HTP6_9FUNG|nr:hypothetical protein H4R20_003438 [Coemansia guatemalensis]
MRTITSAIRPRRRRLTDESNGGINRQWSSMTLGRNASRSTTEETLECAVQNTEAGNLNTAFGNDSVESAGLERGDVEAENAMLGSEDSLDSFGGRQWQSGMRRMDTMPVLHRESMEEEEMLLPIAESTEWDMDAVGAETAISPDALVHMSSQESEVQTPARMRRRPLRVFRLGRPGARPTAATEPLSSQQSVPDRREGREWSSVQPETASQLSNAISAGSSMGSTGLFGGESSLLKRVSSVPGNLSLFRAHLTDPLLHPEFRAPPRYTRHQPMQLAVNEPDDTPIYGYALLLLTSLVFVSSMYSLVVSKFMPYTGIAFLDAVKDDRYFCLLMPITGLSFTFAVFLNWLGMKFFRHN